MEKVMEKKYHLIKNKRFSKLSGYVIGTLLFTPVLALAGDNPWDDGTGAATKHESIVKYVGGKAEEFFKWGFALLGVILIAVGIIIIIHRLNMDAREKEHANLMWTIVMVMACIGIGLALIIFAWTHGLSYTG